MISSSPQQTRTFRRRQTRREFVYTEQAKRAGNRPVEQGRLIESRRAGDARRDIIIRSEHLARDFGKARLVWAEQRQLPEPEKEGNGHHAEQRH